MRVVCIDGDDWAEMSSNTRVIGPATGEECVVTHTINDSYQLSEYNPEYYWRARYFIPLSEKDEREYADGILEQIFVTV